ncbi:unnamed protein product [Moneuplotes crassus]|uniref:Bromo domain-containing protein n=1 Tax=Euplotes crassus TaxID=5936 RepID=A0AAD2DBM2_EUPCR|nr:unnamed protein product [Moneuplotes crassus]
MEREVNYLVLRYLENLLSKEDYESLKEKIIPRLDLPKIHNWSGNQLAIGFEELSRTRFHFPSKYLIDIFEKMMIKSKTPLYNLDNLESAEEEDKEASLVGKTRKLPFSLKKRNFRNFERSQNLHRDFSQNLPGGHQSIQKFEKVKTVYGHAVLGEQGMSISCIEFDYSNKYIITGSDDKLIKIWLVLNGSLQGVLCGHEDVIMDLHVSTCNRYVISAGKDGLVIIWDLKLCKKLHVCKEHKGAVNQIKTVYTKLAASENQLLYTCGDDGLINIYNLDLIENPDIGKDADENTVQTRRAKPKVKKDPLFLFALSSIEFTGLKKDKKIDSIDFSNKRGLLFAGCYGGDLLIWRNDNYRREKFMKVAYELVSKIKYHDQILHLIAISPDDNYFLTGDTDGKVNIWRPPETAQDINELIGDISKDRNPAGNKQKGCFRKHLVATIDGSSEFSISQCDSVEWSYRGRYALASFGGKEERSNNEKSIIYIWDQRKQEIIHKLGSKASGIVLENYTFVLEAHPKDENYFMSGGGAGKVILWDIRTGTQIKSFKEFGHYHRDNNMLDEVFDGKFSSCGNFFAVSTIWGTFSIYSIFNKETYLSTPIEQFFHRDKSAEMSSDIYNIEAPILVNFDRLKQPDQTPLPILGEITSLNDPDQCTKKYMFGLSERIEKYGKDHKFCEDYAVQNEPYFFLNSRNEENQSNHESGSADSIMSSENEENKRDRPVYYDRHNDEFDRESDEDFIVDLENRSNGVRRMPRRTDNPPQPQQPQRQNEGIRQRQERERRRRERNRRRGDDDNSDEDEFIIQDMVENEESEASIDFVMRDEESSVNHTRPNPLYASRSPINESESEEEVIENGVLEKHESCKVVLPSSDWIIPNDAIDGDQIMPVGHYLSINCNEDYQFEQKMEGKGYKIDIEEAQRMIKRDKSNLDCALCKKKGGEGSLIGPFKYFINDLATDEMIYWFHRECLERNDIVEKVSTYEFSKIQECVNQWILNEGNECQRCFTTGASISCTVCKDSYHGFICSFLRLGFDYDGNLVCIRCLKDTLRSQLTDEFLDQVDKSLMEKDFYKNKDRKMFYEQLPGVYTPQIEDEVYFIFQAYEEVVGYYMNHFFSLEDNRDRPIEDYINKFLCHKLTDNNDLTHKPLRCKISNIEYRLPSATTFEINQKLGIKNMDFVIESEVRLQVLEPEQLEEMEFSITYFNHSTREESISMNYLIPLNSFIQSISEEELSEIQGHTLKLSDIHESPLDLIDVVDFEPEVYSNCNFKCVFFKQVCNANPDGHRLRANALGRNLSLRLGRLSIWDIKRASATSTPIKDNLQKNYIENRGFNPENYECAFDEVKTRRLVETIDAFIKNNSYSEFFKDEVTDEITPDYLNIIPVEMNLFTIRDNLESGHYRSKEMLLKDLKLIEDNCIEFNSENSEISKHAKNVHENLKKIFVKAFSYKLRDIPRRTSSLRSRENGIEQEGMNKRNPKKLGSLRKRNARQRTSIDYKEDSEEEKAFKKPTPQRNKRRMLDEESDPSLEDNNFKIDLQQPNSLRRSSRNRNVVSMKEPDTPPGEKGLMRRTLRKREVKEESKNNGVNGISTRQSRGKQSQQNSEFSENGDNYEYEDY